MARLEAQSAVRSALEDALADADVRVAVPDPRPAALVVVRREGGRMLNGLVDSAGIGIEAFAPSEAECASLAMRVSEAMRALAFSDGFADVSEEACRSDYDLARGCPRWYLSYTLRTYAPPDK